MIFPPNLLLFVPRHTIIPPRLLWPQAILSPKFNPQNLANTAWAFATLGMRQEELLGAIAGRALVKLEEFSVQSWVVASWAFATLGVRQVLLSHTVCISFLGSLDYLLSLIAGRALAR